MNRNVNLAAVVFMVLSFSMSFLSGCGKPKSSKPVLRYSSGSHIVYDQIRKQQSESFQSKHPEITVKFEPVPQADGTITNKLLTQMSGGTEPDVFYMDSNYFNTLVRKKVLLDLTPYIENDKEFNAKDIYPKAQDCYKYNDKIYGVPGNLNVIVLFYNKKLFDKEGLKYPDSTWTWEKFMDVAKKLTKKDASGNTTQYGVMIAEEPFSIVMCEVFGGKMFNADKTKCTINNQKCAQAFDFVHDMIHKYHVTPTPAEREQTTGYAQAFFTEKVAMFFSGVWIRTELRKQVNLHWGMALAPKNSEGKRVVQIDHHGWAASARTKNPELAAELIKELTSVEGVKRMVELGDSIPDRKSQAGADYFINDPRYPQEAEMNKMFIGSIKDGFNISQTWPPYIPYGEIYEIYKQGIRRYALTDKKNTQEFLLTTENQMNKLIDSYKNKK
ncbi:MAG: hypothetical protein A3J83_01450 [Elusimicrobia bacterium RIFOXYA2_FULL_40_6]|nr:MAG: hypothetical protein A3J83_01450 [Elusimicrobia bacterium RIFOXYA2_FULL_40_6]